MLDEAAFQAYSPAFYSAGNLLVYGAFFAFYTFTFVFILLDSWRPIATAYRQMGHAAMLQARRVGRGLKGALSSLAKGHVKEAGQYLYNMMNDETSVYDGFDDPFTNMMRNYPEVPDWWFLMIALVAFIFAIILLTQFPDLKVNLHFFRIAESPPTFKYIYTFLGFANLSCYL